MENASNPVLLKENNSEFFEVNKSDGFINDGSHTSFSQIIPEKDTNNNFALNPQENSDILLDPTLDYIRRYLLEEDVDGEISSCQETALKDMEKPFHDILEEIYTPSQDNQLLTRQTQENTKFTICISKDHVGPSFSESLKQHSSIENLLTTEFHRGAKEGMKFLPKIKKLSIDLQVSKSSLDSMKKCDSSLGLGKEKECDLLDKFKGKKSSSNADLDLLEGRNCKIPLVSCEETIRDAMFDKVLLNHGENYAREETSSLREIAELKANYCIMNQKQCNHINIRDLLISCAEAVSMNNRNVASNLIKQIRKQASPVGDGMERLAFVLGDGLGARLAGTGNATYRQLAARRVSVTDHLKAYHLCLSRSPVMRVAYHFADKNILSVAGNASKIHIVDFGISVGFQWPSLIQAFAKMKDEPPRLRITGVDLPQPGFHPAERIKETGKRLEAYARDFGVPFEYHGIASQWESIRIEDFNIRDDEVLIVNNMSKFSVLKGELLLGLNKSRDNILNLIRAIKPNFFMQGIFNFSFSPYFIPRFKMVMLQYSRFFDMLDTLVPRHSKTRQLFETDLFGPSIINQIACEGLDLVGIPETYKQCHVRNLKTGFEQIKLDPSIVKECSEIVSNGNDKGFFIEEDCNWFLQGWKGNIMYAVSLWKPQVEQPCNF